ncbi:MAG: hypothetical protein RL549_619, partial [Verrucomicrobiota bacterium]
MNDRIARYAMIQPSKKISPAFTLTEL